MLQRNWQGGHNECNVKRADVSILWERERARSQVLLQCAKRGYVLAFCPGAPILFCFLSQIFPVESLRGAPSYVTGLPETFWILLCNTCSKVSLYDIPSQKEKKKTNKNKRLFSVLSLFKKYTYSFNSTNQCCEQTAVHFLPIQSR